MAGDTRMTATMDLAAAARMLREATKDLSYRATPLGLEAARYYRWKKNEWGATAETLRDYESILARTALYFAGLMVLCAFSNKSFFGTLTASLTGAA